MSRRRPELTPDMREHIAENMKERVYSTITLLAVIAAHWQTTEHHSAKATALAVGGSAVALWLATIVAARMSYRAVHGRSIQRHEYAKIMFTSSGLIAPAIAPIIFILFSITGLYTLQMALTVSMIVLLLSLFILSFTAGRRIYDNIWRLLTVSGLEMLVGVGVILLKIATGE